MAITRKFNLLGAAVSAIAVGVITYVCFRFHLSLTIPSFLYLIVVVLQSLQGSFVSSAFISVLTVACLDFFFTEPIFSFEVTNSLDICVLISYLITGLVITRLTTRSRREAAISEEQRRQMNLLYDLASQLLALDPGHDLLEESVARFREVFGLRAVCLFDCASGKTYTAGDSAGGLPERTRCAFDQGRDAGDPNAKVCVRCLSAAGESIGAVGLEGIQERYLTIGPLAALAAAVLERSRAFRNASHSAAKAQAEVFRGAVLDALAHEFKTPLATILTAAGGLQEIRPMGPQQQELAELIESEASRLTGLTSQVLQTARLDQSEIKPRFQRINITTLVTGMVRQFSQQWADRKFRVTKGTKSTEVLADSELLELAFKQLLENACKYSTPGTDVEVSVERSEERAAVRVLNSGEPICRGERERIFERFYRGEQTGKKSAGSGLGLYFAQEIVRAHGGNMELEDTTPASPETTSFCLTLPLAQSEC